MHTFSEPAQTHPLASQGDIAIIGMACIFPGAPDVRTYWQNIVDKVDAIGDPPADWEAELFYDPDASANDRIYCKRGGYLGDLARFDPLKYGVMPHSIDGGEPDQFLALRVAYEALTDAGYMERPVDGERVEVIIGRGTYINRGFTTVVQHGLVVDGVLRILKQLHPEHTEAELQAIKQELKASLPPFNAEMAPALVPNIISGRIANRLNFMGANYTVDAACASSLIAVERGVQDLLGRRCDLALVGGVHASTPAPILMIFCQLNAISRRGQIRPFDQDADGTLLGEGLGFVVLKRQEDAERDGDRIYALIKGIGTASDGRALGLLAPRVEGEELALRRAYEVTGISPRTVGLIEAHGTGTPVGDAAEVQALSRVFGPCQDELPWCAVGSVKSMISHLIPAAGVAGLIKSALALYHKVLPPTLHCDTPHPELALEQTPFYINSETRPWIHGASTPRRAGVNAFGFGGINTHIILEEHTGTHAAEGSSYQHRWDTEVCLLQGDSRQDLLHQGEQLHRYVSGAPQVELKDLAYTLNTRRQEAPYCLALVAASLPEVEHKLAYALQRLADPQCRRIREQRGIYFFQEPLSQQGRLAFLFPGEGSQYTNMLADLCMYFPEVRAWFDLIDRAFSTHRRHYLPSQVLFPPPRGKERASQEQDDTRLWQMDCGPEAVFTANQAMFTLLRQLHIQPHVVLGHSTGEYSALFATGANQIASEAQLIQDIIDLNGLYEQLATTGDIPQGVLVAVGGVDRDLVLSLVASSDGLYLAMDNCPHQMVLCGTAPVMQQAIEHLQAKGAVCLPLPFNRAYHTPLFQPFCEQLQAFFQRLTLAPPQIEMYSCTTAQPYPQDAAEMRRLAVEQWARPVRFRETIEAMYQAGVRMFVEVGPRGNLSAFVDDILRGQPYLAVASNLPQRSGITQLNHLIALLAAHGVPMSLDFLYARRAPQRLAFDQVGDGARQSGDTPHSIRLATGLQPLRLARERVYGSTDTVATVQPPLPSRAVPSSEDATVGPAISAGEVCPTQTVTAASDAQPHPPDPGPVAIPTGYVPSPARSMPDSESQQQPGMRATVMQEYLQTMERFLHMQQEVMQAFFHGTAAASTTPRGAEPEAQNPALPASESAPLQREVMWTTDRAAGVTQPQEELLPPSAEARQMSSAAIGQTLLELLSERTGYPTEMLGLTLNLEADLGIDSIKRVEILGAFQQQTGLLQAQDMDRLTGLKTLQEMIDFVTARAQNTQGVDIQSLPNGSPAPLGSSQQVPRLPFIGTIISYVPGQELVALRQLDIDEDLFLHDHTLGRRVSVTDVGLLALPIVPLTMSMEMLAEAAAALLPDKLVVEMKDIRAYRWIALDEGRLTLRLTARRKATAVGQEIEVQITESVDPATPEAPPGAPIIAGTVIFGDRYPDPQPAGAFVLRSARPSMWTSERLYTEVMFHGPAFQGVVSVDRWGEDGIVGTLKALPTNGLLRSGPEPHFLTDPVLLDAAGQLVGYWAAEHLATGFHVFPFRVEAVRLYGPNLRPGERAQCRLRLALDGGDHMRSDIEVIGPDGCLHTQITGWWDKRFDMPDRFYRLRMAPRDVLLSTTWDKPIAPFPMPEAFSCCFLEALTPDFLAAHGKIWQRVLAHLVLSRWERDVWRSLQGSDKRRTEWLLGRVAAKDAVRLFLKRQYDMTLCPADIEIMPDQHGQPCVGGNWTAGLTCVPLVSLAHAAGTAIAVAGHDGQCHGVGVDIEYLGRTGEEFERIAFTPEEHSVLSALDTPAHEEWSLRLWCAKEAVAKALGRGMAGGPGGLRIQTVDRRTGYVQMVLSAGFARELPAFAGRQLTACTAREGNCIVATVLV
jgi:acyl transferase domain-containing protein/phosphopantetheinyl transferase